MAIRIGRTLPPAASPLKVTDIVSGVAGHFEGAGAVRRLEDELKAFYKVGYCFGVSTGRAALVVLLQAMHEIYPERDEVLIPAYTCYSVPSAIIRAGFRVRLCDVAPGTLDFDFHQLVEELLNPRLLCVIPTHLFGVPADVERVKTMVRRRDIFVLEDAAQAMGAGWNGKKLGTLGDAGLFSMGRGKALSAVEGGIILTDSDALGRAVEKRVATMDGYGNMGSFKLLFTAVALSLFIRPQLFWFPKLLPFLKLGKTHFNPSFHIRRMSPFQAGLAKKWKITITEQRSARLANANEIARYGIGLPGPCSGAIPDLIRFPFLVADGESKKKILRKSEKMGLGISGGYPDSIDGIVELGICSAGNRFKNAKDISARMVCLPVHPLVNGNDLRRIVGLLGREEADYGCLPGDLCHESTK